MKGFVVAFYFFDRSFREEPLDILLLSLVSPFRVFFRRSDDDKRAFVVLKKQPLDFLVEEFRIVLDFRLYFFERVTLANLP